MVIKVMDNKRINVIKNISGIEILNDDGKTITIKCDEIETFIYGIVGFKCYHGFLHKHRIQVFVINKFDDNKINVRHAQSMEIDCIENILKEFNIKIIEFNKGVIK